MRELIKRFFRNILTETSEQYDIARVSFFLLVLTYISISVYDVFTEHRIDYIAWATGAAALLGAGGAAVGVRAKLEDHPNIEKTENNCER